MPLWSETHSAVSDSLWPHEPTRLLCPWNSAGQNTGVGSHSLLQGVFPTQGLNPGLPHCRQILPSEPPEVKWSEVAQSCLTPWDPMDCSPPGSTIHGIFQARVLEWVAIAFSTELPGQPPNTIKMSSTAGWLALFIYVAHSSLRLYCLHLKSSFKK